VVIETTRGLSLLLGMEGGVHPGGEREKRKNPLITLIAGFLTPEPGHCRCWKVQWVDVWGGLKCRASSLLWKRHC
jgi:hypothetical protein